MSLNSPGSFRNTSAGTGRVAALAASSPVTCLALAGLVQTTPFSRGTRLPSPSRSGPRHESAGRVRPRRPGAAASRSAHRGAAAGELLANERIGIGLVGRRHLHLDARPSHIRAPRRAAWNGVYTRLPHLRAGDPQCDRVVRIDADPGVRPENCSAFSGTSAIHGGRREFSRCCLRSPARFVSGR